MQTKITNLEAAMLAHKPALQADYARQMRRVYNNLVAAYAGESKNIRKAANSFDHFHMWAVIREVVSYVEQDFATVAIVLNDARVEAVAEALAVEAVEEWRGKLEAKLEGATDAECTYFAGNYITIHAKFNGKPVKIEQQRILNHSPKGKLFNQFPALIYVDGKKVSEAAYKKMTAAA